MTLSQIKRASLFTLILILIFITFSFFYSKALSYTFLTAQTDLKKLNELAYYDIPENTIDILFCGSSTVWTGVSPMTVWDEIGVTSFNRASSIQYSITMYFYLLESLRVQKPQLVVLDAQPALLSFNMEDADASRTTLDSYEVMRASPVKEDFFRAMAETSSSFFIREFGYRVPILVYYPFNSVRRVFKINATQSVLENVNNAKQEYMLGGIMNTYSQEVRFDDNWMTPTDQIATITDIDYKYYIKAIEYCLDNNIQVIILSVPQAGWDYAKHNSIQSICDKYGLVYLDYNEQSMLEKIGLDLDKDYYDTAHMNIEGNFKFSAVLAEDLKQCIDFRKKYDADTIRHWDDLLVEFKYAFGKNLGKSL